MKILTYPDPVRPGEVSDGERVIVKGISPLSLRWAVLWNLCDTALGAKIHTLRPASFHCEEFHIHHQAFELDVCLIWVFFCVRFTWPIGRVYETEKIPSVILDET